MPADPVAVDAGLTRYDLWCNTDRLVKDRHTDGEWVLFEDVLDALHAAEERGAERMRERAAKVAADRSERVLNIIEREVNNNRRHLVDGFDRDVAVAASIATAIRALPTDKET